MTICVKADDCAPAAAALPVSAAVGARTAQARRRPVLRSAEVCPGAGGCGKLRVFRTAESCKWAAGGSGRLRACRATPARAAPAAIPTPPPTTTPAPSDAEAAWDCSLRPQDDGGDLARIVVGCEPLMGQVLAFLAASPQDLARVCATSAAVAAAVALDETSIWRRLFEQRWPVFAECLDAQGANHWRVLYRRTLAGKQECFLEVFERERQPGFAMAAMPARVRYEARLGVYVARYPSATESAVELIIATQEHRLRFCPQAARECLRPPALPSAEPAVASKCYPYQALAGVEGLRVGSAVELQWKMQAGSPFGWWYGILDALSMRADGLAVATISFRHFHATSVWYRLQVEFGDGEVREGAGGGFTGGVRKLSENEERQYMRFFPKAPVVA